MKKEKKQTTVDWKNPITGQRIRVDGLEPVHAALLRSKLAVQKAEAKAGLTTHEDLQRATSALSKTTVREAIEAYYPQISPNTQRRHRGYLETSLKPLSDEPLNRLTASKVWAWWEWLSRATFGASKKPAGLDTRLGVLKTLIAAVKRANREGKTVTTSAGWPNARQLERTMGFDPGKRAALETPEQALRLLEAARQWDAERGTVWADCLTVLIETGMRQAEAAALTVSDCLPCYAEVAIGGEQTKVLIGYEVRVYRQKTREGAYLPIKSTPALVGKNPADWPERRPRPRVVSPLGREALTRLVQRAKANGQEELLFSRQKGGKARVIPTVIQPYTLRAIWQRAGLPHSEKATTHSTRHSTVLLNLRLTGGDVLAAKGAVGHKSIATTQGYLDAVYRPASRDAAVLQEAKEREPLALPGVRVDEPPDYWPIVAGLDWWDGVVGRIERRAKAAGEKAAREAEQDDGASHAEARAASQRARKAERSSYARWRSLRLKEFELAWPMPPEGLTNEGFAGWSRWAERRAK